MWKIDIFTFLCATLLACCVVRPSRAPYWLKGLVVVWLFLFMPRYLYVRLFQTGFMSPDTMPNGLLIYLLWHAMFLWSATLLLLPQMILRWRWKRFPRWGVFLFAASISTYLLWQGFRTTPPIVVHHVDLEELPHAAEGLRVVVLSDMHLDQIRGAEWCASLVARVNALEPDVILFTGDQSDGGSLLRERDLAPLSHLRATQGKFAISGNHEAWFDAPQLEALLERYGIQSLNQRSAEVCGLTLLGIEDERALAFSSAGCRLEALMATLPPTAYPVLLVHKPSVAPYADQYGVRLQLSGHTHGGQLPGLATLIARFNAGFVRGWYELPKGMKLFVAPGCGVWNGFPYRFYRSEITLLILHRKAK